MFVFGALHVEHIRVDPFRAGQLQLTGVSHNSLTRLRAARVCTYIETRGGGLN
jgi:hypothetical protein